MLPSGVCGISRGFPRLSPTPGQVPTRYSPVRHSSPAETGKAFDLHVLSMPPAFVLSQDQTLMFNPDKPTALPDSRPVVQGPAPAQRPDPIRATKRSRDTVTPPKASQPRTKPYLAARPTALSRRPRIPSLFIM